MKDLNYSEAINKALEVFAYFFAVWWAYGLFKLIVVIRLETPKAYTPKSIIITFAICFAIIVIASIGVNALFKNPTSALTTFCVCLPCSLVAIIRGYSKNRD